MIAELSQQRDQVSEAIMALEVLALGRGKRRRQATCLDDRSQTERPEKARAPVRQQEQAERTGFSLTFTRGIYSGY